MLLHGEEVIAAVKDLAGKLGRSPRYAEVIREVNVTRRQIQRMFGGWAGVLEESGCERVRLGGAELTMHDQHSATAKTHHGGTETRRKAKANHKGHKGRRRAIARNAKIPKKSKVKNRKIFETQRNRGNGGKSSPAKAGNRGRRSFTRPFFYPPVLR